MFAQLDAHGLRAVLLDYEGMEEEVCSEGDGLHCSVYGLGADGYTKVAVGLSAADAERYPKLTLEFGAYSWIDVPFPDPANEDELQPPAWRDAEAPQGDAGVTITLPDGDGLGPGSELPFFGKVEPIGDVPEGSRLLVPPYNPSSTYGFAGIFLVEDESALDGIAAMAEEAATGDQLADEQLTAGDLRSHHVSYDGSAGGCFTDFDAVTPPDGPVIARLHVVCD